MTNANQIKFLGTSDEVTVCGCCGRSDLKRTVALSIDDADPVYFGVVCAARALKMPAKEVRTHTKHADDAKSEARRIAILEAQEARMAPWVAFLSKHGSGSDMAEQIHSLGGYIKAWEMYDQASA